MNSPHPLPFESLQAVQGGAASASPARGSSTCPICSSHTVLQQVSDGHDGLVVLGASLRGV